MTQRMENLYPSLRAPPDNCQQEWKGGVKREGVVKFELWRQDDNGNRFLVGAFQDRAGAETMLAELTRNLHKQTYWITEIKSQCGSADDAEIGV
jgi:hypothetical protein